MDGCLAVYLFRLLVSTFVPNGPVAIGLGSALERRAGTKIAARGIYRARPGPATATRQASDLRSPSDITLPEIAGAQ